MTTTTLIPDYDDRFLCYVKEKSARKLYIYFFFRYIDFPSFWLISIIVCILSCNFSCWVSFSNNLIWTFVAPVLAVCMVRFNFAIRLQHNCS